MRNKKYDYTNIFAEFRICWKKKPILSREKFSENNFHRQLFCVKCVFNVTKCEIFIAGIKSARILLYRLCIFGDSNRYTGGISVAKLMGSLWCAHFSRRTNPIGLLFSGECYNFDWINFLMLAWYLNSLTKFEIVTACCTSGTVTQFTGIFNWFELGSTNAFNRNYPMYADSWY